jgi:hypothetical protein
VVEKKVLEESDPNDCLGRLLRAACFYSTIVTLDIHFKHLYGGQCYFPGRITFEISLKHSQSFCFMKD